VAARTVSLSEDIGFSFKLCGVVVEAPPLLCGSIIYKAEVVTTLSLQAIVHHYRVEVVRALLLLDESCVQLLGERPELHLEVTHLLLDISCILEEEIDCLGSVTHLAKV
jgi:hypothetical protein